MSSPTIQLPEVTLCPLPGYKDFFRLNSSEDKAAAAVWDPRLFCPGMEGDDFVRCINDMRYEQRACDCTFLFSCRFRYKKEDIVLLTTDTQGKVYTDPKLWSESMFSMFLSSCFTYTNNNPRPLSRVIASCC